MHIVCDFTTSPLWREFSKGCFCHLLHSQTKEVKVIYRTQGPSWNCMKIQGSFCKNLSFFFFFFPYCLNFTLNYVRYTDHWNKRKKKDFRSSPSKITSVYGMMSMSGTRVWWVRIKRCTRTSRLPRPLVPWPSTAHPLGCTGPAQSMQSTCAAADPQPRFFRVGSSRARVVWPNLQLQSNLSPIRQW